MPSLHVYKFMPFQLDGSIKVITDNTMMFTHPSNLNDPFDCRPAISENLPDLIYDRHYNLIGSREEMLDIIKEELESGKYWGDVVDNVGVAAFCKNAINPLMWAHYAQDHKGFVAEFELPVLEYEQATVNKNEQLLRAMPICKVRYTKDRPQLSSIDESQWVKEYLLKKSKDWKYEREYRAIRVGPRRNPEQSGKRDEFSYGHGVKTFNQERLKSIIAGERMPMEQYEYLQHLVDCFNAKNERRDETSLRLYRARSHSQRFEIEIPGHPRANNHARRPPEEDLIG